jgi:GWxTD domain-containing protein
MAERDLNRTALERAEQRLAEVQMKIRELHRANAEAAQNTAAARTQVAELMARRSQLEAALTRIQDNAAGHDRRIRYATERFGNADSPRGRIYVQNGPPWEIESHPAGPQEIWRYPGGQEFEFRGQGYELVRFRFNGKDFEPRR